MRELKAQQSHNFWMHISNKKTSIRIQNLSWKLWQHHIFNNNFRKRNRQVTRSSTRGRAWEDSTHNLSGQLKSLGSSRTASAGMLPWDVPVQSCSTPVLGETVQEETRYPDYWESQNYQQKEHKGCSHTPLGRADGQHFRARETTNTALTTCSFCCWQWTAAQGQLRGSSGRIIKAGFIYLIIDSFF